MKINEQKLQLALKDLFERARNEVSHFEDDSLPLDGIGKDIGEIDGVVVTIFLRSVEEPPEFNNGVIFFRGNSVSTDIYVETERVEELVTEMVARSNEAWTTRNVDDKNIIHSFVYEEVGIINGFIVTLECNRIEEEEEYSPDDHDGCIEP